MRMATQERLVLMTIVLALLAGALAQVEATPYGVERRTPPTDVAPLAWNCSDWSPWQTISTYCTSEVLCGNGCLVRIRLMQQTRTCRDEAGNVFIDTETYEFHYGCCNTGPGEQCLNPFRAILQVETTNDLVPGGE
jgi:hypothetical protein